MEKEPRNHKIPFLIFKNIFGQFLSLTDLSPNADISIPIGVSPFQQSQKADLELFYLVGVDSSLSGETCLLDLILFVETTSD